jgi:hypothetical protein
MTSFFARAVKIEIARTGRQREVTMLRVIAEAVSERYDWSASSPGVASDRSSLRLGGLQ